MQRIFFSLNPKFSLVANLKTLKSNQIATGEKIERQIEHSLNAAQHTKGKINMGSEPKPSKGSKGDKKKPSGSERSDKRDRAGDAWDEQKDRVIGESKSHR
jgi:hypothetical protein